VSNIAGERMVMVPNYPLNRPKQKICPFTCDLVQMRQISVFGSYIYPVHVGGSFTLFPTLASTFYWIALQVGKGDDGRMGVCVCVCVCVRKHVYSNLGCVKACVVVCCSGYAAVACCSVCGL
jgi:hypothetical protein